ncbi:MAG: tyrosine-protein phosphatase [Desulfobacterales bacterium]
MFIPNSTLVELTETGDYRIEWRVRLPGLPVTVFTGFSVENIDFTRPLITQECPPALISGLDGNARRYFSLCLQDVDVEVVAERRLPLEGAKNFRDIGGYYTRDGRRVKWGKVFRSGRLSDLTERDLTYFSSLDIQLICDFRREDEQMISPSRLADEDHVTVVNLPIGAGSSKSFLERIEKRQADPADMMELMNDIYLDFAENQADRYAEMFRCLLETGEGACLIHCTAGKDRTGFGTALILYALGVDPDTIMQDYLLTRRYFPIESEMRLMALKYEIPQDVYLEVMRPVFEVHPVYLQTAVRYIEEHYGSIEDYIENALGISRGMREDLMDRYLES